MQQANKADKPKRSLKSNYAYQASYQILLILTPLITTPYLSRTLGAENVGTFSYTQAIANYFVMFAMLGMSTYGVREIAAADDDRNARSSTFWSAYTAQLCIGVPVAIAYCVYTASLQSAGGFVIALVWGMWVFSALLDISWLLFGVEEFKIPTIRSIATRLASLVVIFALVRGPQDLWIYCAAIAGSFLANQILIWPFVRRYIDWRRPHWDDIARHFKPNLILFVPVIAISLYTLMDKILLGTIAGVEQAGYFEYSEKLSKMPLALVTAMGTVMLPRMTAELSANRRDAALDLLEDSIWAMLAMAFAFAFGIAAIAPEFAPVFLGDEFAECDTIMMVLAITIPTISVTNVIGHQYLIPTKRDKFYTVSVCIGAAVNVVVNLVLIPLLGAIGTAIATVAAEVAVLVVQVCFVLGELPILRYFANAVPFVIIGIMMAVSIRMLAAQLNSAWGLTPLGLVIEVLTGGALFAVLAAVWSAITKDRRFSTIRNRSGSK